MRVLLSSIGSRGDVQPIRDQSLRACLQPEVTARAQALSGRMQLRGAQIAAQRLADEYG